MLLKREKGFTLVELMVVISIIGILAVALTTQVTKSRALGKSMRCKTNLRNLSQAALNCGVVYGRLPWAGPFEFVDRNVVNGRPVAGYSRNALYDSAKDTWRSGPWVDWTGSGRWWNRQPQYGSMKNACFYGDNAYESITNGVLWELVGKDLSVYRCDVHRDAAVREGCKKVLRSYVMNSYFGYANVGQGRATSHRSAESSVAALSDRGSAANLLLFAELPARKVDKTEYPADGVLEVKIRGYTDKNSREEIIGFNHQVSKKYVAHVAFADGHVEVVAEPSGAKDADLKELTRLLCNGDEITQTLREKMR